MRRPPMAGAASARGDSHRPHVLATLLQQTLRHKPPRGWAPLGRTHKREQESRHDGLEEGIHVEVEGGLKDDGRQQPDHEELQAA
eukprot:scaffold20407_cov192-Isochrysis_galbana.AAC.1